MHARMHAGRQAAGKDVDKGFVLNLSVLRALLTTAVAGITGRSLWAGWGLDRNNPLATPSSASKHGL